MTGLQWEVIFVGHFPKKKTRNFHKHNHNHNKIHEKTLSLQKN